MDQVQKFARKFFLGNGSSSSRAALQLLESRGVEGILDLPMSDPATYESASAYYADALVAGLFKKALVPGDADKRKRAAVQTFWACEARCAATNAELSRYVNKQGPFRDSFDERVLRFIDAWRKNVKTVLGRLPDILTPAFSSGSTLSDTGHLTTIPDKMSSVPTVYRSTLDIWRHCVENTILSRREPQIEKSNLFFTVPKDSSKDRGCCVEASGSLALQLAVGKIITDRYERRYKVDMRHGKELHMAVARHASIFDDYATIDLSNASDTISKKLVELLLPDDWFTLLNSLRASSTDVFGTTVVLNKFSSMGNGYTFPLETLLFRTLCETVAPDGEAWCFGDDIIVAKAHAANVLSMLRLFGFEPNARKTFCEGPFRESCGGDYWRGQAVRPFYVRTLPDEPQHWVAIANGLSRAGLCKSAAWFFAVNQLPLAWRNFTSDVKLGDFAVYDPQAEPRMRTFKSGDERARLPAWRGMLSIPKTKELEKHFWPDVQLAAAVFGVKHDVAIRNTCAGFRLGYVPAWGSSWLPSGEPRRYGPKPIDLGPVPKYR